MRRDDLLNINRVEYSSFLTKIMTQSVMCIIIFLGMFFLAQNNQELIGKIGNYLNKDIQWEYIYNTFIELKDRTLQ